MRIEFDPDSIPRRVGVPRLGRHTDGVRKSSPLFSVADKDNTTVSRFYLTQRERVFPGPYPDPVRRQTGTGTLLATDRLASSRTHLKRARGGGERAPPLFSDRPLPE